MKKNKLKSCQFLKPIILILISIILYALPQILAPTYQIGILPVDNISQKELITINSSFKTYNKYFQSQILNETLNSSYIKQENGFLLNDDFFKYKNITHIKQKYDLDFLIITTDKQIKDFNKGGFGIWGQADTVTETVLMTTIYFGNDKKILPSIAQHEIFHLFGYLHNPIEKNGIMQYKDNIGTQELSNYYNIQLPIRIFVKQFITNQSFGVNYFLINLILVLALYPLFLGLNQILQILLKNKKIKINNKINHISSNLGLFILFCMNFGHLVLFASIFLSLSINYCLCFRKIENNYIDN